MIDLLLGGEGKATEPRELTDIEEAILSGVVEAICRELTTAWQPVGLSFSFEKRQMQTQTPRLIPVSEKTLCLSFELRLAESSGLLNLAFPAVASNTILRRLAGERSRQRRHSIETRRRMVELTGTCRTGAALHLPAVRVPASALSNLHPGSLLRLDLASGSPAEFVPAEFCCSRPPLSATPASRRPSDRGPRGEAMNKPNSWIGKLEAEISGELGQPVSLAIGGELPRAIEVLCRCPRGSRSAPGSGQQRRR